MLAPLREAVTTLGYRTLLDESMPVSEERLVFLYMKCLQRLLRLGEIDQDRAIELSLMAPNILVYTPTVGWHHPTEIGNEFPDYLTDDVKQYTQEIFWPLIGAV